MYTNQYKMQLKHLFLVFQITVLLCDYGPNEFKSKLHFLRTSSIMMAVLQDWESEKISFDSTNKHLEQDRRILQVKIMAPSYCEVYLSI